MTTPADPGAIDLEPIRETWQHRGVAPRRIIMSLIAAVEALRERVAELERHHNLYKHVAKSVRGALDGEHTQRDILKIFDEQIDRTEAAETRVVEVAGVLERVRQCCLFEEDLGATGVTTDPHIDEQLFKDICTVLSATPAEALERARAVEEVIIAAREINACTSARSAGWAAIDGKLDSALTKLDALGKESGNG